MKFNNNSCRSSLTTRKQLYICISAYCKKNIIIKHIKIKMTYNVRLSHHFLDTLKSRMIKIVDY